MVYEARDFTRLTTPLLHSPPMDSRPGSLYSFEWKTLDSRGAILVNRERKEGGIKKKKVKEKNEEEEEEEEATHLYAGHAGQ